MYAISWGIAALFTMIFAPLYILHLYLESRREQRDNFEYWEDHDKAIKERVADNLDDMPDWFKRKWLLVGVRRK